MSNFQPLPKSSDTIRGWRTDTQIASFAQEMVIPLYGEEIASAALEYPVAFTRQGGQYLPVAVVGLQSGKNLYVSPDSRWLARYQPVLVRAYPFRLGSMSDGKQALCVDMDAVTDVAENEATTIYKPEGGLAERVDRVFQALHKLSATQTVTAQVIQSLEEAGVIKPWAIRLKLPGGLEQAIEGLWQIDEKLLMALEDATILKLARNGALALAHCQLLSMRNFDILPELHKIHGTPAAVPASKSLDGLFGINASGDSVNFSGFLQ